MAGKFEFWTGSTIWLESLKFSLVSFRSGGDPCSVGCIVRKLVLIACGGGPVSAGKFEYFCLVAESSAGLLEQGRRSTTLPQKLGSLNFRTTLLVLKFLPI